MEISYSEANRVATECKNVEGMGCKKRYEYRDCDRVLCCGFCPTIDECENTCTLLMEKIWKE